VEDLDSTNGTYVNGVRVTRSHVAEGDRIVVGGTVVKVVARDDAPRASTAAAHAAALASASSQPPVMQGCLDEVPLPDLLQMLGGAGNTGVLSIRTDGHTAELHLHHGRVMGCVIDGRADVPAEKGFHRLLAWSSGRFELRGAPSFAEGPEPAAQSIEALLLEGMRQLDELKRLRCKLPARFVTGAAPTDSLDEQDRSLLALAARNDTLDEVLDATPLSDLEAARRLNSLFERGLLVGDLSADCPG
jgi:hypothetical protein